MSLNRTQIVDWLYRCGDIFTKESDFLTGLDKEIGDADHGLNMHRGFSKVVEKLPSIADKDIGFILKNTGMTLLSNVGGASGPLFGTFFIRAAQVTQAHQSLTLDELYLIAAALDAACEVAERAAHATITMQARKGRASYLGERSIGHQDPGATSVLFMVQMLAAAAKE